MDGIISYALSKKYTQESLLGGGAVVGKNVIVSSITETDDGNVVTFSYTLDNGTVKTSTMTVKNGEQGNGIVKVEKIKSVDLVDTYRMTFTDGSIFDYDVVNGGGSYSGTSGIDLGGIKKNQAFNNATMQEMFDMLLHPYEKPTMTLGINPSKTIYDKVTETLASITINANVTKKTENIKEVRFYVDNVLVNTDTTHPNGGLVSYTHTFASPTNTTFNVKIECEDIKGATSKVSANTNIYFVGKSYYGVIESDGSPFVVTEDLIKGLSKKEVKIKKALTYQNINATFGRIVYAYPKNLPSGGALTSIKDQGTGWSVFDSYTSQEITIDGITYLCYYMIDAGGFDGVTMIFA